MTIVLIFFIVFCQCIKFLNPKLFMAFKKADINLFIFYHYHYFCTNNPYFIIYVMCASTYTFIINVSNMIYIVPSETYYC